MCGVKSWPVATACSVTANVVNCLKYKQSMLYFVFEINFKSILYFVSNTLPKSIFHNCGDGNRHVAFG